MAQLTPQEKVPGYDYWICSCGEKNCRTEIRRVRCYNDGELTSDENKCEYCLAEEIPDLFINEEKIVIDNELLEPDGFEEIDEATAEGI